MSDKPTSVTGQSDRATYSVSGRVAELSFIHSLVCQPIGQSTNVISQSVSQSVSQSELVSQSVSRSVNRAIGRPLHSMSLCRSATHIVCVDMLLKLSVALRRTHTISHLDTLYSRSVTLYGE
jgi:hypothetical protein